MKLGSASKSSIGPVRFLFALALFWASSSAIAQESNSHPKDSPKAAENKGLQLPAWAAEANWRPLAAPFQDALIKGGDLVLKVPASLQKRMAQARIVPPAEREVLRAVAVRAQRANANQQMEQQIKQMIPQYRNQYLHVLHGELQSIRRDCEIPKESRAEVYGAAEAAYDKSLEQFVRNMYFPTERGQSGSAMRSAIRAALVTQLEKKLPAGEFAAVQQAIQDRSALRMRICIHSVLSRIDDSMRLTREQREKISQSLLSNWSDDWESWLMLWQYEENYLPQIDDSLIVVHLTPQQRRIWQQSQKISLRGVSNAEFAGEFDTEYWNVKPKKADGVEVIERLER
jgi:hypothetical protein